MSMLSAALRYPLATGEGRDGFAVCAGLLVAILLLVRLAAALWPATLALAPVLLVLVPAVLFAGYLGSVLRADVDDPTPPPFRWSRGTVRTGLRLFAVGIVYVLPAVIALLAAVFVLLETGATPTGSPLLALAPTVALFALLAAGYFLPAALAAGLHGGVRAGLSRSALRGLAGAAYFFGWTTSLSVAVLAGSLLAVAGPRSPLAVVGAVVAAYGAVVAVRLQAQGLARSGWEPPA